MFREAAAGQAGRHKPEMADRPPAPPGRPQGLYNKNQPRKPGGTMEDQRNILFNEKPFSYKLLKDHKAQLYWRSQPVSVINGKDYNKLLRVIALDNIYELQLFLAKITGQFKRGNERGVGK